MYVIGKLQELPRVYVSLRYNGLSMVSDMGRLQGLPHVYDIINLRNLPRVYDISNLNGPFTGVRYQ